MALRTVEMDFEFSNEIDAPPKNPKELFSQACSNDKTTVETWSKQWLEQIEANHKRFGSFKDHGIGELYKLNYLKPAIVVGSGPSLKENALLLKNTYGIPVISCLHNFHYFIDNDLRCGGAGGK